MRFVDEVEIVIQSGRGGKGSSSFRREKYVEFGGPDGGDGGRGGHIIFRAVRGLTTLFGLRSSPHWRAENGTGGGARRKTGAEGADLYITVPIGTSVTDPESGNTLFELLTDGEERIALLGGEGGLGNTHFKTSTHRAPRETTPGGPSQTLRVHVELRLVADVGLLGWPNAGKSTLISTISAARPKIADYPFTTLVPNLGVVSMGTEGEFVVADIPGLIEGAAEGKGLGHQFLRHVERTRMLLHLVALGEDDPNGSPVQRWSVLRDELRRYDALLVNRPEIVVLTKADAALDEEAEEARTALLAAGAPEVWIISAATGQGVRPLVSRVWTRLRELRDVADGAPGV